MSLGWSEGLTLGSDGNQIGQQRSPIQAERAELHGEGDSAPYGLCGH